MGKVNKQADLICSKLLIVLAFGSYTGSSDPLLLAKKKKVLFVSANNRQCSTKQDGTNVVESQNSDSKFKIFDCQEMNLQWKYGE